MSSVTRSYRGVSADDRRRLRRSALLEACLAVIGAHGTASVTAESVAAEARLTKRYFYENFTDRDAVLQVLLDEMYVELLTGIRSAIVGTTVDSRATVIAEVFVATLCHDPRRARLYAESAAHPALARRREDAIVAFTELIVDTDDPPSGVGRMQRLLKTRIVVAGVTEVVTSWINGTLNADRATLTAAIVDLGRATTISP